MTRILAVLLFASSLASVACFADQAVPTDHSTVHIVFIVPTSAPPMQNGDVPVARVGDIVVPYESIRPVSISIDGEFVGHALFGYHDVKPVFVLPSGIRNFTFACEGFKTTDTELKVLGTGSKQYLVVKLPIDDAAQGGSNKASIESAPNTQGAG